MSYEIFPRNWKTANPHNIKIKYGNRQVLTHNNIPAHPGWIKKLTTQNNQPVNQAAINSLLAFMNERVKNREALVKFVNAILYRRRAIQKEFETGYLKRLKQHVNYKKFLENSIEKKTRNLAKNNNNIRNIVNRINKHQASNNNRKTLRSLASTKNRRIKKWLENIEIENTSFKQNIKSNLSHAKHIAMWAWVRNILEPATFTNKRVIQILTNLFGNKSVVLSNRNVGNLI